MDMAGIGVKPKMRSGPCVWMVWMRAAATSTAASSQDTRTKPPLPRSTW